VQVAQPSYRSQLRGSSNGNQLSCKPPAGRKKLSESWSFLARTAFDPGVAMIHFRPFPAWQLNYPSTSQALFAIALWPVLFAIGCWRTPQIALLLTSHGVDVSMGQMFQAGLGAYVLLLAHHRRLNRRHFERHAGEIELYRRLSEVEREMALGGLTHTHAYQTVKSESAQLRERLGFLIDADNFYRKLQSLTQIFRRLLSKRR